MHFESKVGDFLKSIISVCEAIEKKQAHNFNPWAFVQRWANKNGHPAAILDSLVAIKKSNIRNPWAYGNKIMSVQSGNYYEAEHIRQTEEFKDSWEASAEIKEILVDMFTKI